MPIQIRMPDWLKTRTTVVEKYCICKPIVAKRGAQAKRGSYFYRRIFPRYGRTESTYRPFVSRDTTPILGIRATRRSASDGFYRSNQKDRCSSKPPPRGDDQVGIGEVTTRRSGTGDQRPGDQGQGDQVIRDRHGILNDASELRTANRVRVTVEADQRG